jgi:hypothetical protein
MASVAGWLRRRLKRLPELLEKVREGSMSGEPNGVLERERRLDDVLGDDGEVKLWSAFTGQELLSLDQHPGGSAPSPFRVKGERWRRAAAWTDGKEEHTCGCPPGAGSRGNRAVRAQRQRHRERQRHPRPG